jgi:uncharacterized protein DUF5336
MSSTNPVDNFKSLNRNDQIVLGTGVLAFIFSFFPYWGGSASGGGISASSSVTAWHSYSTIALLLILIGTALTAVVLFSKDSLPSMAVGPRWIAAGLCTLGAVLYLIRLFTLPSDSTDFGAGKISYGVKWGGYLLLIIILVNAVFAVLNALSSEESKPWEQGGGTTAPPAPPTSPEPPAAPPTV